MDIVVIASFLFILLFVLLAVSPYANKVVRTVCVVMCVGILTTAWIMIEREARQIKQFMEVIDKTSGDERKALEQALDNYIKLGVLRR